MQNRIVTALAARLRAHIPLSKSRLETLCLLIVGAIGARTVNLGHVATERGGRVKPASTYRRLQRFFQHVRLGQDWAAPLIAATLGTERWTLVLDRTNWKIGRSEVNYLVLAAVTRRRRVPLLWTLLPHGGGSASADRIALMRRYLAHFPVASIRLLLGDREFIGAEWLKFLNDNNIPFAIRIRDNLRVTDEAGHELTLHARLHRARRSRVFDARLGAGEDAAGMPLLHFAAKCIEREWLIVVSNRPARAALEAYRKRWAIECLFAEAKTRGLNMEDTRLTDRAAPPAHGHHRPGAGLGRRHRRRALRLPPPCPQGARIPGQILVPHRPRPSPTRLQNRGQPPANPLRSLQKTESRVVCVHPSLTTIIW